MWFIALLVIAAVIVWIVARKNPDFKEKVGAAIVAAGAALAAVWEQLMAWWA